MPCLPDCRDLGITITSELSPALHIQQITAEANQRANAVLRCFVSRNIRLLVRAFVVYVRPVLEYNSVTWSPHLKQDITWIEKVQRQFIKKTTWLQMPNIHRAFSQTRPPKKRTATIASGSYLLLQDCLWSCWTWVFRFFEFSLSSTRGHAYKFYKVRCCSARAIFLPAESLLCGTVSLIPSVLLVSRPLKGLLRWLIFTSF